VSKNYKIFYDRAGNTLVAQNNQVLICEQDVRLQSYDVEKVTGRGDNNIFFDYYKGHRFDAENHNWIVFNEYISLSFSFMTFVIRDSSQIRDSYLDENYLFDVEQYNFIINRKTCFNCDDLVQKNFEKLSYILSKLEEIDPDLLDQLNYYF
jgi:hypothetical protein